MKVKNNFPFLEVEFFLQICTIIYAKVYKYMMTITYTNKNPKGGAVCTPYDKCKKARNATECNQGKSLV